MPFSLHNRYVAIKKKKKKRKKNTIFEFSMHILILLTHVERFLELCNFKLLQWPEDDENNVEHTKTVNNKCMKKVIKDNVLIVIELMNISERL